MWICRKISKDFLEVSSESYCARNTFPEVTWGFCDVRKQEVFFRDGRGHANKIEQ